MMVRWGTVKTVCIICYTLDRKAFSWAFTATLQIKKESTHHASITENWRNVSVEISFSCLGLTASYTCVCSFVCFHCSIHYFTLFHDLLKVDLLLDSVYFIHKYIFYLENGKFLMWLCAIQLYIIYFSSLFFLQTLCSLSPLIF